ncbi:MAG TPA: tetratricopeptide repeat protein, partial [Candidatus Polarisedimenticolia bacterium]|nr:tetratricopeptide repeat protein [Candidatus Polarisedimenticolia bacterium]
MRRFPIVAWLALMLLGGGAHLVGAVLCGGLLAGEEATGGPPGEPADPVEALLRRGNAARQRGQIAAALDAYRGAERLAPQRYEVRLLIADTLRRTGRPDQAAGEYDAALRIDPRRHEGYAGQAIVRRAAYDYDGAAAILEAALGRVAEIHRPDLLLTLAETRRRQGRLEEAGRLFRQVLEARPGETPIYAGLAQVAEARGDIDAAVADWDLYLKGKPDDDGAALRRQELLEVKASIEALRTTAARPRGAAIPAEIGRLLAIAGDARGAALSFRQALEIDPENGEARRGLALALRDTGDGPGASAQFRRLLRKHPRDAVALYNLVGLARAAGDLKAEESAWRALLDALPGDLVAARSFVAFAERANDGALEREIERETIAARRPGAPGPGGNAAAARRAAALGRRLALLLAAAGRWGEAAGALDEVLHADPSDPWTEEVVNEILQARPTFLQALIERERSDQPGSAEAFGGAEAAPRLLVRARLTWWAGRAGDALILMRQAAAADARSPIASAVLAVGYQTIARDGALALRE